ncbi:MAG: HDIG domain-containing protein [Candidatus Hatepunaea meridiana]|nr:HDIG domain-containing protein [Candidatus Hatepunaea meridiana]
MIDRDTALELVNKSVSNENLIKHMIATEAVMRALAFRAGEDVDLWGITGLLHDLDYDETVNDFPRHGYRTAEILESQLPPEALHAIRAHPGHIPPESSFAWALFCADPITGLITAASLMHPSHTLAGLQVKSVKKRFKDKRFAAGASREQILTCSEIGLEKDEFLELALNAMRGVSDQLGL